MSQAHKHNVLSTGFAMFSMLFGAGNVVFPLLVGQHAESGVGFAMIGLLITAVAIPFIGLLSITLYNGDYHPFFGRIGRIPGFAIACFLMALIGPFGAAPRTITLSHATIAMYLPSVTLPVFSILSCLLIFFLTYRKRAILDLLGFVLTPVLLGSLAIIVIKGLWTAGTALPASMTPLESLSFGLTEGYNTMDLPGALFFSSVVISCLSAENSDPNNPAQTKRLVTLTLKASIVGALLLGLTYLGFSYLAAFHREALTGVADEALMGVLAQHILGPYAGIVACVAVSLACLTTAIALTTVFAEFLQRDILRDHLGYVSCLLVTLAIMFGVSTLEFGGIAKILSPINRLVYPSLIVLAVLNLAHKIWMVQPVRVPVACTFIGSLAFFLMI